jgi:effector-binding domain-containing protein
MRTLTLRDSQACKPLFWIPKESCSNSMQVLPQSFKPGMTHSRSTGPGSLPRPVWHAITILVYDRGMPVSVNLQTVHSRKLAAVRREVAPGAVGSAWGPALGKVWEFIRSQPGLRTDGHNIFLYHHPTQPGAPILCDFGVEVTRTFETAGEVYATETQGGEAAVAVHRGPYTRMNEAHDAIGKWMAANRRESAGHSWEIYGDPTPDPADTETTVVYLLK